MTDNELIKIATDAMNYSYSPYSGFKVGAALLTESGNVFTGCNIENSAFSPTLCAERVAFSKAVSDGEKKFSKIAIVGGKDGKIENLCPPCGVCRQFMQEFCNGDFKIILTDKTNPVTVLTLGELLPHSFGTENLR